MKKYPFLPPKKPPYGTFSLNAVRCKVLENDLKKLSTCAILFKK